MDRIEIKVSTKFDKELTGIELVRNVYMIGKRALVCWSTEKNSKYKMKILLEDSEAKIRHDHIYKDKDIITNNLIIAKQMMSQLYFENVVS